MSGSQETEFRKLGDLHVAKPFVELFRANGLVDLDALLAYQPAEKLTKPRLPDWRERFRMELAVGASPPAAFYVKRYRPPAPFARRRRLLGRSARHGTAWIEWQWIHRLTADGIPTMTAVTFGERLVGGRELASVIVTAALPGVSLERWAADGQEQCPRDLIASLARLVARFHRLGYVHRDLYLSHVFLDAEAGDERERLRLIDLQRVFPPRWRRERWQVKDLAALNYSTPRQVAWATDRVRFLRQYLGCRRLGPGGKRLARLVASKARRIAAHDQRRLGDLHRPVTTGEPDT